MSRTYSTITWGLALIVSAVVLAWQQSIPWAIASAGAVAVIIGIVKAQMDDVADNAPKKRTVSDQIIGAPED
jgi:hypothetical protein